MTHRYQMVWFNNPSAPLGVGRTLFGHSPAEAIAHAMQLWQEGAYASALGYCVVDTEDGNVLWRQRRATSGNPQPAGGHGA